VSDVSVVQVGGVVSRLHVEPASVETYRENTCAGVMSPSAHDVAVPHVKVVMASLFAK
jgi:hypothetical protein